MGEIHGSCTRIYANGLDISTLFREAEFGRDRALVDTTCFAATDDKHVIDPMAKGITKAGGILDVDPSTGARVVKDMLDASAENLDGDSVLVTMGRDTTIGDPGFALIGSMQQHRVKQLLRDVVQTTFDAESNRALWVSALHPLAARTAAHNSTGLDNSASSAYGGVGILTVTALSGTNPVLAAKVQHSSDSTNGVDGTWVDLATHAAINAAGVAAGYADAQVLTSTVNRWLRIAVSVTSGSLTSVTFASQFGRYTANK